MMFYAAKTQVRGEMLVRRLCDRWNERDAADFEKYGVEGDATVVEEDGAEGDAALLHWRRRWENELIEIGLKYKIGLAQMGFWVEGFWKLIGLEF